MECNEVEATDHSLEAENPDADFVGCTTAGSETCEEFDEADSEADNPDDDFLEYVRINSKIKLPHQTTTRLQAMLLILTFVVAASLNWTQVDSLLKLLNTLMGKQVFPPSKYGFRKLWDLQRSKTVEVHPYCSTCHFLTTSCGKNQRCDICGKTKTLAWLLKQGSFFLTMDVKHKLLCLLNRTKELVGKKLKELAASPWGGFYADVTDGLVYRKARTEQKMRWSDLTVTINSDGSPVFKSSKHSLWPIQVSLNELPPPHCWRNLIVGAIWFQKEHPPPHLFLKTFVDRFRKIGTLTWSFSEQTVRSAVNVVCCCVDSPARAALLNAKQYNGYYGCSWCYQQGKPVERTVKYIFEGDEMLERSHEMVVTAMKLAVQRGCFVDGVKGPSAIVGLPALDLVWGLPPDYLHCVLEGVVSQRMELWLSLEKLTHTIKSKVDKIDDCLVNIRPPIFFTRLPRSLSEKTFWKATEWKFWLLYYGMPCLEGILPSKYVEHFSLLSQSVFMLLKSKIEESEVFLAGEMLKKFVEGVPTLYNDAALTFNVHQLVHLAKSVRMTGPMWVTSTFPFEGGNGDLLKLVSAAKGVPQQIAERCVMRESLQSLKRLVPLSPFLRGRQRAIAGKKTGQEQSGVLGAPLPPFPLEDRVEQLITAVVGPVTAVCEFLRVRINGVVMHSAKYERPERTCSEYFESTDGKLCRVLGIFRVNGEVLLLCQELISERSFTPFIFQVEHPPRNVGLCVLLQENFLSPCVYIDVKSKAFLARIPNLYERD
ncbi:hypothetical protein HPB48_023638 [Haemaphysalis longicornis]|uniref:Cr1-8 nvi n=1 Tax=Haemaphysalis longicornis TaxID=44386 RepID=A0A9J6H5Q6_HAELO|nr:hypothetical protein HPB48_023638 [Haemaphysalis longicornis]